MRRSIFLCIVLLVFAGSNVFAISLFNSGNRKGTCAVDYDDDHQVYLERSLGRAGVSDADITRAVNLMVAGKESQTDTYVELCMLNNEIALLVSGDNPSMSEIRPMVSQAAGLREQLTLSAIETGLQIRGIVGDTAWNTIAKRGGFYGKDDYDDDDDDRGRRRRR